MTARLLGASRIFVMALLLAAGGACALLPGCGGPQKTASIGTLKVRRYREYVEEGRTTVRVVGEVENTGEAVVEAVEVHVTLRDAHGSATGMNMTLLEDLQPGEIRVFDLGVTRHGATAAVTLELAQPTEAP